eukprot:scaffold4118_cov257-Pinguiococcus_pyrenoidosus.AAC.7
MTRKGEDQLANCSETCPKRAHHSSDSSRLHPHVKVSLRKRVLLSSFLPETSDLQSQNTIRLVTISLGRLCWISSDLCAPHMPRSVLPMA